MISPFSGFGFDQSDLTLTPPTLIGSGSINTEGLNLTVREPTVEDTTRALLMGSESSHETPRSNVVLEELSEQETRQLLNRLPSIQVQSGDQKDFFMR